MPKTIIVMPCYNEEQRIEPEAFQAFAQANPDITLLLVDDGSKDGTWPLLEKMAAASPVRALKLPVNGGKAEAVRQGFLAALKEKPDLVGFWDSDLATPLEDIPLFIHELMADDKLIMVTGCRLMRLGSNIRRKPLRHYLGRFCATLVSLHLNLPVYDTQCGAKIMRADAAEKASVRPFASRWFFDVEIYKRLRRVYGRETLMDGVLEVPLLRWYEQPGSKLRLGSAFKEFLKMLRSGD